MPKHVPSGALNARVWFAHERPAWPEKCCHCCRHLPAERGRFRLSICPAEYSDAYYRAEMRSAVEAAREVLAAAGGAA